MLWIFQCLCDFRLNLIKSLDLKNSLGLLHSNGLKNKITDRSITLFIPKDSVSVDTAAATVFQNVCLTTTKILSKHSRCKDLHPQIFRIQFLYSQLWIFYATPDPQFIHYINSEMSAGGFLKLNKHHWPKASNF